MTVEMDPATTSSTPPPSTTTTEDIPREPDIRPVGVERLGHSWREGCPVSVEELRLLTVPYLDFDGAAALGEVVVHQEFADQVLSVFQRIFELGYPIQSVIPIGDLPEGAEDETHYNNTSGYQCRFVDGTTRWSRHAHGTAIDLNPLQNPLIDGKQVWPSGSDFVDRSSQHPAMITSGDGVVAAFESIGWGWGGHWKSLKDYHHFSSTGT